MATTEAEVQPSESRLRYDNRVLRDRIKSLDAELQALKASRKSEQTVPLSKYEAMEKLAAERFALLDALERQNRDLIAKLAAAKAQIEDLEKIRPTAMAAEKKE